MESLGTPVPLDSEQQNFNRKRFYPSLVLYKSLTEVCERGPARKPADPPPHSNQSSEEKFKTFVNKLAQICDFEPRGKTVTSCAVLQLPTKVLYLFVSNDRAKNALKTMRKGIVEVLGTLKDNIQSDYAMTDDALKLRLLRRILHMNHVRVRSYLELLGKQIQKCVGFCELNPGKETDGITKTLREILSLMPAAGTRGQKSDEFIDPVVRLISAIQFHQSQPVKRLMEIRAAKENAPHCWAEVQHATGRLVAYDYAAETLVAAHHLWADTNLFLDFEVDVLPSSGRHPCPLKGQPETAHEIIGRMTSKARVQKYRDHAVELQKFNLDEMIRAQWETNPSPMVHSEILLLDWLQNTDDGTQPHRFFKGWPYIGASKPTCFMCKCYFDIAAPGVGVRECHNNVYIPWRCPDTYTDNPKDVDDPKKAAGLLRWYDVMHPLKKRVCDEALHILEEKVSYKKKHDSNTTTDRVKVEDQLGGMLSSLRIGDAEIGRR